MSAAPPPDQIIRSLQKGNLSVHIYHIRDRVTRQLVDPDTLAVIVTDPAGTATTYSYTGSDTAVWTKRSRGTYMAEIPHTAIGTWKIKMEATEPTVVFVAHVMVIDAAP